MAAASLGLQMKALVLDMRQSRIQHTEALRIFSREWLLQALEANGLNECKTARELGVHRNTLHRMTRVQQIDLPRLRKRAQAVKLSGWQGKRQIA